MTEQEQVFLSPPASPPLEPGGSWVCQDAEDCPCSLCGARYRIWAFELHLETEDTVEPADLQEMIQELVEPALHNYPLEGWSFAHYGFYEPRLPGTRQYCVLVTTGAECLPSDLGRSLNQALRCLQPRDAADVLVDVGGHGRRGECYDPDTFWFWVRCCIQRISGGARSPSHVGFGSKRHVMNNLREQMRAASPLLDVV